MAQTYQSGYSKTIALFAAAAATSIEVSVAPTVTKGRMFITDGNQKEWISYTGVTGTTLTGVTRGLSQTADPVTSGTGIDWMAGTPITLIAMHDQLVDKNEPTTTLLISTTYATTGARDAALGANGAALYPYSNIYVTATGLHYNYNLATGQWETVETGTTTPNASTTVAGKVELATQTEFDAGTATGGTGASLVSTPDFTFKQINTATAKTTMVVDDLFGIADSADSGKIKKLKLSELLATTNAQATEITSGVVERATDAEALAGTDTTRYTTVKQTKDNYGFYQMINTSFETAARFNATATGGTIAYDTSGLTLSTGNAASQRQYVSFNTGNSKLFNGGIFCWVGTLCSNIQDATDGEINILISDSVAAVTGYNVTLNHIGFRVKSKAAASFDLYAVTGAGAGTETLITNIVAASKELTLMFKNNLTSVDFWYVDNGTKSAVTNITTNIPSAATTCTNLTIGVNKGAANSFTYMKLIATNMYYRK